MDPETLEQRIRARAYELWQEDGSMEGCADEYWQRARALAEEELAAERRQGERVDGAGSEGNAA